MTHTYRIICIGNLWRLMRDDQLHSTYTTQGAAKAGMATEQNRDEVRGGKAEIAVLKSSIVSLKLELEKVYETKAIIVLETSKGLTPIGDMVAKALALADEMERTGNQDSAMRLREIFNGE